MDENDVFTGAKCQCALKIAAQPPELRREGPGKPQLHEASASLHEKLHWNLKNINTY